MVATLKAATLAMATASDTQKEDGMGKAFVNIGFGMLMIIMIGCFVLGFVAAQVLYRRNEKKKVSEDKVVRQRRQAKDMRSQNFRSTQQMRAAAVAGLRY